MDANTMSFLSFLAIPQQIKIPVFQRKYSWEEEHCQDLWDDIIQSAQNKSPHFIGSIVYIKKANNAGIIPEHIVIDGQQRLTTITLLLFALIEKLKECPMDNMNPEQIKNQYLINKEEESEKHFKIMLTKPDREVLKKLLTGQSIEDDRYHNIIKNYKFFKQKIEENILEIKSIFEGMLYLHIVGIGIVKGQDNPQEIFESLNSTGLDLTAVDEIRNYVLMDMELQEQEIMYDKYWRSMEDKFTKESGSQEPFNRFFRNYLTIKYNETINENKVYPKFKKYVKDQKISMEEIMKDILYYSKIFININNCRFEDEQINEIMQRIDWLDQSASYPFLMKVYVDFENKIIKNKNELIEIYLLVESFLFRRIICNVSTSGLNKTFLAIIKEITPHEYLESLKTSMIMLKKTQRFPDDIEFSTEFLSKDMYNRHRKSRIDYLFDTLENFGHEKEYIPTNDLQIEHIIPQNQNVSKEWKEELGEDWSRIRHEYLHKIGNLTKTGYNQNMSDKSFTEKKNMIKGFKNSPLKLNQYLAEVANWNEEQIITRGKILLKDALDIWKYPQVSPEIMVEIKAKEDELSDEDIDDEEEDETFDQRMAQVNPELNNTINSIIEKIEKFDCVSTTKGLWKRFHVSRPYNRETRFVAIRCGKKTSRIAFRVDPENFDSDDDDIKIMAGRGFFPKGTDARMSINEETINKALNCIEKSLEITKNQ